MDYYVSFKPHFTVSGRTARAGLGNPQPISVYANYDNTFSFQLQTEERALINPVGLNIVGIIRDAEGIIVFEKAMKMTSNRMMLNLSQFDTKVLKQGMYQLDFVMRENNKETPLKNTRYGRNGFVLDVKTSTF